MIESIIFITYFFIKVQTTNKLTSMTFFVKSYYYRTIAFYLNFLSRKDGFTLKKRVAAKFVFIPTEPLSDVDSL